MAGGFNFFEDVKNYAKTGVKDVAKVTRALGPELSKCINDDDFKRRVSDAKDRGVDAVASEFKAAAETEKEQKHDNDER